MADVIETTDAAGDTTTAYILGIGQTARGTISSTADHDWYKINLTAGQTYTFALVGTGASHLYDPNLRLFGTDGANLLASNDNGLPNNNSIITFTASTSGAYYLDAGYGSFGNTGQYGLSATTGTKANFDTDMGTGVIDTHATWSAVRGTGATVTYAFRQNAATYTAGTHDISTFTQVGAAQQAAIQAVLQYYSELTGLTFQQVNPGGYSDNAAILFGDYQSTTDGSGAFAYYPGSTVSTSAAGDVWLNKNSVSQTSLPVGSYSFDTLMHEIGHALGLSHPGLYNAAAGVSITYANNAQFIQDSRMYSVMSYFNESNTGGNTGGYPDTPMLFDVAALQLIYGANTQTRTGNTVYGFNSNAGPVYDFTANNTPAICIWDAGGSDTLDCSGFSQNQTITLVAGQFSSIGGLSNNVSIAVGASIETAIGGSGNDTIIGNDKAYSYLYGSGGNDVIYGNNGGAYIDGGSGADQLIGGGGNDTIVYDANDDLANVLGGGGSDILLVINGTAPTDFNLATHQFEIGDVHTTGAATGQAFNYRDNYYNTNWQLTESDTYNNDGSHSQTLFDIANIQTWSQVTTSYNAAGITTQQSVLNDDNSSEVIIWDRANTQTWSLADTHYDTQNRTTQQSVVNDDNSSRTTYWDPSNVQLWSTIDTFYDAQGRTTIQSTGNDNGTTRTLYFDPANIQPWTTADTYYDAAGRTTLQSVANDNGTTQTQYWDTTNAYNWATVIHYYNTAGVRTLTTGVYDDGTTFSY